MIGRLVCFVIGCLCLTATCFADIGPGPRLRYGDRDSDGRIVIDLDDAVVNGDPRERSRPLPLRIEKDAASPHHRIVIPAAVLAAMRNEAEESASDVRNPSSRSIFAAVALSAAAALGLVAYRRGRTWKVAAVLACGIAAAEAIHVPLHDVARADIPAGVFGRERRRPETAVPKAVMLGQGTSVIVEVTRDGQKDVVLIVGDPQGREE